MTIDETVALIDANQWLIETVYPTDYLPFIWFMRMGGVLSEPRGIRLLDGI